METLHTILVSSVSPARNTKGRAGSPETPAPSARLLARARERFFLHGFRGVTMDHLATELRMSKKTLYAHYPGKTALLNAVMQSKFQHMERDLQAATSGPGSPFATRLQNLLACVREHTSEIKPPFVRDTRAEAPELYTFLQQERQKLIDRYFGQLLNEGRKAGCVRKDIPVAFMTEMLIGAVDAIANPERLDELGLTLRAAFTRIMSLFLHGALLPQGDARRAQPRKKP